MRASAATQHTHQDDLLDLLGGAPVEHARGVVLLHAHVHVLDLLVPGDEQRVVSAVGKGATTDIRKTHKVFIAT